jgi:hypothetical protein
MRTWSPFSAGSGAGLLAGALLFFLCYWWLGTITVSAVVAVATAGLIGLLGRGPRGPSAR